MRKAKSNLPAASRKPRGLLVKLILALVIFSLLLFIIARYLVSILETWDYFKVKEVVFLQPNIKSADFLYLKGNNIFKIDLKKESEYISELYPGYKRIRLVRVLPDRIAVDFLVRRPLAYIRLYRNFCVDEEGVLLDVPVGKPGQELPVITGLETKMFGPRAGTKYNLKELSIALDVIKEFSKANDLRIYNISKINVAKASEASFVIADTVEVKIGQDNIRQKLNILSSVLTQAKSDFYKIQYIDLRFKEPVVKFKNDVK